MHILGSPAIPSVFTLGNFLNRAKLMAYMLDTDPPESHTQHNVLFNMLNTLTKKDSFNGTFNTFLLCYNGTQKCFTVLMTY